MSNSLTLERLKVIAYRVIAVNTLEKGYDFVQTFKLLHSQNNLDADTAFKITLRVHRGGGFTKDYLYLTGLRKIYQFYQKKNNLTSLLSGKTSLEYLGHINYLYDNKFAVPPKYITDSFENNSNHNKKLDFILKNLR